MKLMLAEERRFKQVKQDMRAVPVNPGAGIKIRTADIPAYVGTDLAQAAFEALRRDYNRPEVQAEYQRWKAERAAYEANKEVNL